MNANQVDPALWVAKVVKASYRRSLFGLRRGKATLVRPDKNMHLYVRSRTADGTQEVRREMPEEGGSIATEDGDQGVYVSLAPWPLSLVFSSVLRDKSGHKWDLHMCGTWSVTESRRFACSTALDAVSPGMSVSNDLIQSWMIHVTASRAQDALQGNGIEDLRDRDALPARWWEKQLSKWLGEHGISLHVGEIEFTSAQASAAEAETARQRDLERVAQARQQEREVELREAAANAKYEKRKKQIESDVNLSDQERTHQLQLLEKRHRKELIEADTQIENARREAEKAALEHEATLARLREDAETAKHAEERNRLAEDRHQEIVEELNALKSTLTKLADLPENLLAQLADQDPRKANEAAERIVSPEFGISAFSLAGLGFRVERQNLVQVLREKAAADGDIVSIRKTELVTRDIGTAKVKGLPINTSLQFKFSTEWSGYVTLLNIGTSGSVYVHVPNAYVALEQAKVDGGRSYGIPGPELLPWDRLRQLGLDYVEIGPPGWEHVAVLLSNKPLVSAHALKKANSGTPFVKLVSNDIGELCDTLNNEPCDAWSAAVLSFLVG